VRAAKAAAAEMGRRQWVGNGLAVVAAAGAVPIGRSPIARVIAGLSCQLSLWSGGSHGPQGRIATVDPKSVLGGDHNDALGISTHSAGFILSAAEGLGAAARAGSAADRADSPAGDTITTAYS